MLQRVRRLPLTSLHNKCRIPGGGKSGRLKTSTSEETVDTVLDQARLLSSILNTVADGPLNVPLLKGVAGLAERIIIVTQVSVCVSHRGVEYA